MAFYLTEDREHVRLKTYDATMKGKTTVLRITVEITDPYELAYILKGLEDLKEPPAPKRRPTAKPSTATHRKLLASEPMLALPYIESDE